MRLVELLLAIAGLPWLGGCMSAQQSNRMAEALDPYIGQTVASYVAEKGDPASSVSLGERKYAFRWVFNVEGAGAVVPIASSLVVVPPRQLVCTVTLTAATTSLATMPEFRDWIITGYRWEGAC